MGNNELANALGVSKALVSKLVGRGMPTSSASAAQAWREVNAPPRTWKSKTSPSPITSRPKSAPSATPSAPSPTASPSPSASAAPATAPPATEGADTPAESLRRARSTERASYRKLELLQRDKTASPEDLRKGSSVYFSSRANRQKAEADHRDHLRAEGITLFLEEAQDIAARPHLAARNLLSSGAKELSVRCYGRSQRQIEATISDWLDRLAATIHSSI